MNEDARGQPGFGVTRFTSGSLRVNGMDGTVRLSARRSALLSRDVVAAHADFDSPADVALATWWAGTGVTVQVAGVEVQGGRAEVILEVGDPESPCLLHPTRRLLDRGRIWERADDRLACPDTRSWIRTECRLAGSRCRSEIRLSTCQPPATIRTYCRLVCSGAARDRVIGTGALVWTGGRSVDQPPAYRHSCTPRPCGQSWLLVRIGWRRRLRLAMGVLRLSGR